MNSKTPLPFDTNKFQAPDAPMFTQFRPTCETGTSFVTLDVFYYQKVTFCHQANHNKFIDRLLEIKTCQTVRARPTYCSQHILNHYRKYKLTYKTKVPTQTTSKNSKHV